MTPEEEAISGLVRSYGLRKCETAGCDHPPCVPRPAMVPQSDRRGLDGLLWECECGWSRLVKLQGLAK